VGRDPLGDNVTQVAELAKHTVLVFFVWGGRDPAWPSRNHAPLTTATESMLHHDAIMEISDTGCDVLV
jgi:hypothetical protein